MPHSWIRVGIFMMILGGFTCPGCFALTIAEAGPAYLQLALSGDGVDAAGKSFLVGHLTLTFTGGKLYPLRVGGELVGAFFFGRQLSGMSPPILWRRPYSGPTRSACQSPGRCRQRHRRSGGERPPVHFGGRRGHFGGPVPPESAFGGPVAGAFSRHQTRFAGDQGVRYPQLMAQARLEPTPLPVVTVEMQAQRNDLRYVFDPLCSGYEWISVLNKSQSRISFLKDRRYADDLSLQAIGRKRLEPYSRRFLLSAVDLTLVNPADLRAEMEAVETFQILAPLRTLELRLWSRRMGTSGASGTPDEHEYTLRSVNLENGEAVPFFHHNHCLVVQLPRSYAAGEIVVLKFKASGDVLFRPGNDNYWELGTASWYPVPPRLEMQAFTYHAICKVPKPFTPFSNGRTIRQWEEGNLRCAEFREEKPIQLPVILAGKYKFILRDAGRRHRLGFLLCHGQRNGHQEACEPGLRFPGILPSLPGGLPVPGAQAHQGWNDYGYGQAPSGIVFITQEAFTPMQDDVSKIFSEGINARLAHEIAHQWWGG